MQAPEKQRERTAGRQFPPGPKGLPILGNLLEMGKSDSLDGMINLWKEYGDIAHLKMGPVNAYVLFHPDSIHHILVKNQKNYVKGTGYNGLRLMLGQGLVTSDGEIWRQDRRLLQPFFTPAAVKHYTQLMVESIEQMLKRWEAAGRQEQPVLMDEEMMALTMNVISQAMFSMDLGEELEEVGQALRESFAFIPERTAGPMLPLAFPLPKHRRFQHNMEVIDAFIRERIEAGRKTEQDNLLSTMLRAQDEESGYRLNDKQLRDEVLTLFFAGFETTARSLTWGWYLLSEHPQALQAIAWEAGQVLGDRKPDVEDVPALKYSRQVVDETLRLYPPTAMLARQNVEQDEIAGYTIPAGSFIILSPYVAHRHPKVWKDPDKFDPHRFDYSEHPKNAYIPFASGPRVCLGNSFALLEMVLTFSMAARRFELKRLESGKIGYIFAGTIRPDQPLWMQVKRRAG